MTHYLVPIKRKKNREYLEIGVKENHLYFREENEGARGLVQNRGIPDRRRRSYEGTLHRLVQEIAATRNKKFTAVISEAVIEVTEGVGKCLI